MTGTRLVLTAMTLAGSLLSFVGYTLFVRQMGASAHVDALFYASSVPLAMAGTCSGVFLYLLPPFLTSLDSAAQDSVARAVAATLMGAGFIACLGVAAWSFAKGDALFALLLVGFIVTAVATAVATIAICISQARGAYLVSGAVPFIAASGLLCGALAAVYWRTEWLLLIGQLLGAMASLAVASRSAGLFRAVSIRRDIWNGASALQTLRPHALDIAMGTMAFTLFQPIDAALCSLLGGGAMTTMAYALRVIVAVGTTVSMGAFAVAARAARDTLERDGSRGVRALALREVTRICAFGLAVWSIYALGADRWVVNFLQSAALPPADAERLAKVLYWTLLGVGPMATVPYLFRIFYSLSMYAAPARIGICIPVAYGALAWLGLPRLGLVALACAFAAVWWCALGACLIVLSRSVHANNVAPV